MDFKTPIKRSAVYTEPYGLKLEKELKDKIKYLSEIEGKNAPDVPELVRIGIRAVINREFEKHKSAS